MPLKILIVDDDPSLRKLAVVNLEARDYEVEAVPGGYEAIESFRREPPDLIILDLIMPGISGIEVINWVRAQSDVPIIVLSAREDEEHIVQALDAGADDYIVKPIKPEPFLARIRAVTRRAMGELGPDDKVRQLEIDGLRIDLDARRVLLDGEDVHLTRTEFSLLTELVENTDKVLSHDELLTRVWGPEYQGTHQYLYVYLGRIRDKLGETYGPLVKTVSNIGYVFSSTAEPDA